MYKIASNKIGLIAGRRGGCNLAIGVIPTSLCDVTSIGVCANRAQTSLRAWIAILQISTESFIQFIHNTTIVRLSIVTSCIALHALYICICVCVCKRKHTLIKPASTNVDTYMTATNATINIDNLFIFDSLIL
jgi:hypothetical protein